MEHRDTFECTIPSKPHSHKNSELRVTSSFEQLSKRVLVSETEHNQKSHLKVVNKVLAATRFLICSGRGRRATASSIEASWGKTSCVYGSASLRTTENSVRLSNGKSSRECKWSVLHEWQGPVSDTVITKLLRAGGNISIFDQRPRLKRPKTPYGCRTPTNRLTDLELLPGQKIPMHRSPT